MQLRIPGPTPLPDEVLDAMHRPMISHRGGEFRDLLRDVTERLRCCFQTEHDVLVFPGAGTGGLEAAIANLFSPGDEVLAVTVGAFGDRFAEIAARFGLRVTRLVSPWGQAADLDALRGALARTHSAKGVLLTHNETSTGVQNDVEAVSRLLDARLGLRPLLVVDAISSMGAVDIPVDRWGIDVAVTASQKAWMAPPGLTMLSVGPRAWEANKHAALPRFYWDFAEARRWLDRWETPYTPAVSLLWGLQASLRLLMDEGLPSVFARHERLRDKVRRGASALGYTPFAPDEIASRTVTALLPPDSITAPEVTAALKREGIVVAGGQGPLEGKIVRVGHMGFASERDMGEVLAAMAAAAGVAWADPQGGRTMHPDSYAKSLSGRNAVQTPKG
ncbi:MAG TPA: alanine--glyoxylate aminotransferase family protein [Chloroflexia bacterium]|nr:alanine--glyoxylate aminotransferase family protein [Chloroflexia bacterium]